MAPWRGSIKYATYTILSHCSQPCWPASTAQPRATCSANHTRLATQESNFHPARHLHFHTEHATQAPPSLPEHGRQERKQRRFTRTHTRTNIIKHQLDVYSTQVCPSALEATCSHPEACTHCTHVGQECNLTDTPLLWQCLPLTDCE